MANRIARPIAALMLAVLMAGCARLGVGLVHGGGSQAWLAGFARQLAAGTAGLPPWSAAWCGAGLVRCRLR